MSNSPPTRPGVFEISPIRMATASPSASPVKLDCSSLPLSEIPYKYSESERTPNRQQELASFSPFNSHFPQSPFVAANSPSERLDSQEANIEESFYGSNDIRHTTRAAHFRASGKQEREDELSFSQNGIFESQTSPRLLISLRQTPPPSSTFKTKSESRDDTATTEKRPGSRKMTPRTKRKLSRSPINSLMKNYLRRISPPPAYEPEHSPAKEKRRLEQRKEQRRQEMTKIIRHLDQELKTVRSNRSQTTLNTPSPPKRRNAGGKSSSPFSKSIIPAGYISPTSTLTSSHQTAPSNQKSRIMSRNQGHAKSCLTSPLFTKSKSSFTRSSSKSPGVRSQPLAPRLDAKDVIRDLLDDEHNLISRFFAAKGVRSSQEAAKRVTSMGNLSVSHLQQSDSFFQNLTTHLDNQMRGIALLIAEKKELEGHNAQLLKQVNAVATDSNQLKVAVYNKSKELQAAMEQGAGLSAEIQQIRAILVEIRAEKGERITGEREAVIAMQRERERRRDEIIVNRERREQERRMMMETQRGLHAEIKRLSLRNEETTRLMAELKHNSCYSRRLESTRNEMLREKGRLLQQLISGEKLGDQERRKVRCSREVMRDVDKILSVYK